MLACESTFPHAGSFALYEDPSLPSVGRSRELARVLERHGDIALIGLPLRLGAAGNRRVPVADLIDGTPLTFVEEDELGHLRQALRTRVRGRRQLQERHDALRSRQLNQVIMRAHKAKWAAAMVEQRKAAA